MEEKSLIILSTPTCTKCKYMIPQIKELCDTKGIKYTQMNALKEGLDLVESFNIKSVPTLVFQEGDNNPVLLTGDSIVQDLSNILEG